jgi:hypothetical protein
MESVGKAAGRPGGLVRGRSGPKVLSRAAAEFAYEAERDIGEVWRDFSIAGPKRPGVVGVWGQGIALARISICPKFHAAFFKTIGRLKDRGSVELSHERRPSRVWRKSRGVNRA